jgi:hypothetical protein
MAKSIAQINKAIFPHGFELVKGAGYFYFWPLLGAPLDIDTPPSIYCTSVKEITVESCVEAVTEARG